jgi:arylsulfatase A-like enzyme
MIATAVGADLARRPNIVFILLDNCGKEWWGCYGSEEGCTPQLDRLAREGLRVGNCYAPPVCGPARITALTGRYLFRSGMVLHHDAALYSGGGLDSRREITFARLLREAGYRTGIAGKWQINNLYDEPDALARHGFDESLVWPGSIDRDKVGAADLERFAQAVGDADAKFLSRFNNNIESRYWDPVLMRDGRRETHSGKFGPDLLQAFAFDFLRRHRDRPFLLYYPMVLTHGQSVNQPAVPTPLNRTPARPRKALYADMLRYADKLIGELTAELDRLGLRENTVVFVATDNGTEKALSARCNGRDVQGGLYQLTEAGSNVPLIVNSPALVPGGRTMNLADFSDLLPTFCELAGARLPAGVAMDGRSFAAFLRGTPGAREPRQWIFNMYGDERVVRDGRYKLYNDGRLFDLAQDRDEREELKQGVDAERKRLQAVLDAMPPNAPPPFELRSLSAFSRRQKAQQQQRPNILLVLGDNWSRHAGAYGTEIVQTPNFDRLAREGVLFTHAFCPVPSCTPTRNAMLTGQATHRLEDGASLWSHLPKKFPVYPDLLEASGYTVGYCGKGWSPGDFKAGGRERNPAGPQFKDFAQFLKTAPTDKPFCFWLGNVDTARHKIKAGAGVAAGMKPNAVRVPPYLPDTPEVRSDILDYYEAVQRYDAVLGETLRQLEESGRAANTVVVAGSDNGWQFPRGLANCYDSGTHVPLAVRWSGVAKAGLRVDDFVDLTDTAPTFLEIAGLKSVPEMTGRSFVGLLRGETQPGRDAMFMERERHANVRAGDLGYPCRAIRTKQFLYIRNLHPERWAAGDPEFYWSVGPYGDVDGSPTKELVLARKDEPAMKTFYDLSFAKRPAEELYDLAKDPHQIVNVAGRAEYADAKKQLRARLDQWMKDTADPRAAGDTDVFDKYPYYAKRQKKK